MHGVAHVYIITYSYFHRLPALGVKSWFWDRGFWERGFWDRGFSKISLFFSLYQPRRYLKKVQPFSQLPIASIVVDQIWCLWNILSLWCWIYHHCLGYIYIYIVFYTWHKLSIPDAISNIDLISSTVEPTQELTKPRTWSRSNLVLVLNPTTKP